MKTLFALTLLLLTGSWSHAHSRLKASNEIKIRSTDPGIKTGPCGGVARAAQPAVLTPGQTITVNWEETIYHPGRFEFYFSAGGDKDFTLLKSVPNNQNNANTPHQFSTTLTLPNVSCDACTFQMIQVMAENPANPTYYYSCSDMQLKATNNNPNPTVTPTPTPTPIVDDCPI